MKYKLHQGPQQKKDPLMIMFCNWIGPLLGKFNIVLLFALNLILFYSLY
jgi:hypothetical protein